MPGDREVAQDRASPLQQVVADDGCERRCGYTNVALRSTVMSGRGSQASLRLEVFDRCLARRAAGGRWAFSVEVALLAGLSPMPSTNRRRGGRAAEDRISETNLAGERSRLCVRWVVPIWASSASPPSSAGSSLSCADSALATRREQRRHATMSEFSFSVVHPLSRRRVGLAQPERRSAGGRVRAVPRSSGMRSW